MVDGLAVDQYGSLEKLLVECDRNALAYVEALVEVDVLEFPDALVFGIDLGLGKTIDRVVDLLAAVESDHGASALKGIGDFLCRLDVVAVCSPACGEVVSEHGEGRAVDDICESPVREVQLADGLLCEDRSDFRICLEDPDVAVCCDTEPVAHSHRLVPVEDLCRSCPREKGPELLCVLMCKRSKCPLLSFRDDFLSAETHRGLRNDIIPVLCSGHAYIAVHRITVDAERAAI